MRIPPPAGISFFFKCSDTAVILAWTTATLPKTKCIAGPVLWYWPQRLRPEPDGLPHHDNSFVTCHPPLPCVVASAGTLKQHQVVPCPLQLPELVGAGDLDVHLHKRRFLVGHQVGSCEVTGHQCCHANSDPTCSHRLPLLLERAEALLGRAGSPPWTRTSTQKNHPCPGRRKTPTTRRWWGSGCGCRDRPAPRPSAVDRTASPWYSPML